MNLVPGTSFTRKSKSYIVTKLHTACQNLFVADPMQQPEEEPIIQPSKIVLDYPTIAVHGTPESWLLHSQLVTMASNHDDGSFEDTSSSLGDSSYDFIDDRSIVTSDDEESQSAMTHSISSDEHDIDRNNKHPAGPSAPINDTQGGRFTNIRLGSVFTNRGDSSQTESELTTRDVDVNNESIVKASLGHDQSMSEDEDKQTLITLTETTPQDSMKPIEGFHTLRVFTGPDVAHMFRNVLSGFSPSRVTIKVKQTMVSQGLRLEEPYKVLYIGDTIAKDSIIQKIGAALAATARVDEARPSKFNIVPISAFGDTTSPDVVLIDSSGLELNVDECLSSTFVRKEEGNDTICMTLADGMVVKSSWSGSRFSISDHWNLPDVAILYLSAKDTISAKQTERFARSFMNRHNVPTILVSDVPLWSSGAENHTLDPRTPHLLLESYSPSAGKNRILNRLPVDLPTFIHLDSGQMNRTLAYLAFASGSSTFRRTNDPASKIENINAKATGSANDGRWFDGIFDGFRKVVPPALLVLLPMILFHLITSITFRQVRGPEPIVHTGIHTHSATTFEITSLPPISAASTLTRSQSSVVPNAVSFLSGPLHVPQSISRVHENTDITSYLASFLADTYPSTPNNSDKFKVHVVGDRHIVLRPPYWFTRSRKAPKLLFNVTRERSVLQHEVSPLFDGVYALKIRHADAYGVLNISVWTTSKPRIHETFQVALKTSWLKMDSWKNAVNGIAESIRRDVDFVANALAITRDHTGRELRTLVQDITEKIALFTKEAARLKAVSSNVSRKLQGHRTSVPRIVSQHVQQVREGFTLRSGKQRSMISHHAGRVSRDIEALMHRFRKHKEEHLRKSQKGALKAWWRIRGVPKQKKSLKEAKGGLHERTTRSKKTISR